MMKKKLLMLASVVAFFPMIASAALQEVPVLVQNPVPGSPPAHLVRGFLNFPPAIEIAPAAVDADVVNGFNPLNPVFQQINFEDNPFIPFGGLQENGPVPMEIDDGNAEVLLDR